MLRIFDWRYGEFVKSINDDVCIQVHESKFTEPDQYIILDNDKLYLGTYPRMQGHRSYGEEIGTGEALEALDEMYCDEREYQQLKERYEGIELIKRLINS